MIIFAKLNYFLYRLLTPILASLLVCGCHLVDVLNATVSHRGYKIIRDIAYGPHKRQRLDLYIPNKLLTPLKTIVFFYGGSWQFGNKNMYRFVGQAFASKGFIIAIVDYRLYPEVRFPTFVEDGASALSFIHHHIKQYGGDPNAVFLAGHSAGAFIAAMLTVDAHYINALGGHLSWIKGCIGIAGPYDFLPLTDLKIKAIFSDVSDADSQPINYVTSNLPPFFLATGRTDKDVKPQNTYHLAAKLHRFFVPVTEIVYPNLGHIEIILSLTPIFRYKSSLLNDVSQFIENTR